MKVALVSPYGDALVGGIVNWTNHIVSYYQDHCAGIDLLLLYNRHPVGLYGKGNLFQSIKTGVSNYLPVCKEFQKLSRVEHFDVVHVSSSAGLGLFRDLLILRTAKKRGVKMCVHMHFGRIPQIMESKGWESIVFKYLIKRVDCVIVMDMTSYNALKCYGYNNVSYLPNPLGVSVQRMIKERGNEVREPRSVLFAGHITATKGVYELVKACCELNDVKLNLYGKILGKKTKSELYKIAGDESAKWLKVPGNKTMEIVVKAMKSCAVFALPSYSEGFPNVIIEAMACGCPIVATNVGAIPEMLNIDSDEPCGICVEPRNKKELKDALNKILENRDFAQTLGQRAQKRVYDMYSMPIVWEQLTTIWRSVLY